MHPADVFVPDLVTLEARKTPNALAIVDNEFSTDGRAQPSSLTYGELDARSNDLSAYLRSLNLGPDAVVGVLFRRSIAQIVGALGVMKAGAAYLPLDPGQPRERLSFMLRDARAGIVLASPDATLPAALDGVRCLHLAWDGSFDSEPDAVAGAATLHGRAQARTSSGRGQARTSSGRAQARTLGERVQTRTLGGQAQAPLEPADLAYVIYTSGSTGQPKGVEVTHAGLANLAGWHRRTFHVEPTDRASHSSAVGFDAAVWEVWPYLTAGACVHIASDDIAREPHALVEWFTAHGITLAFVSAPMAERLFDVDYSPDIALRAMLTGADVLHRYPPASLPFALYNNYGPTEASVVATSGRVKPAVADEAKLPSIGRAIDNVELFILDANGIRQERGAEGELCIAGVALARGYRGQPGLTAEKFVWLSFDGEPAVRVYRTGDRARQLSDGRIDFLGRVDDQVKIRGFRIEPREIEVALNAHADVLESAAIVREFAPGEEQLVAYLVTKPGRRLALSDIQAFLAERLPAYMLPARFVELPALPLTSNGKIDRAALRTGDTAASMVTGPYAAPRTSTEARLAQIVASLLKLDRVSVDDDFFKLGGHSLLGTQLIARVRDAFGVRMNLRFLFESPTIARLAAEIERLKAAPAASLPEPDEAIAAFNANGAEPALFFFHNDGDYGGAYCERLAAAIGSSQPMYAVARHGTAGLPELPSVEAMARDYYRRIKVLRPLGPYRLGGFCFGGTVAFELARRLRANGDVVEHVVIINRDASPRLRLPGSDELVRRVGLNRRLDAKMRFIAIDFVLLLLLCAERGFGHLVHFSKKWVGRIPAIIAGRLSVHFFGPGGRPPSETLLALRVANATYHPRRYDGKVTLVWSSGIEPAAMSDLVPGDAKMGWGEIAAHVDLLPMGGDHFSPIRERVDELGGLLAGVFRRDAGDSLRATAASDVPPAGLQLSGTAARP